MRSELKNRERNFPASAETAVITVATAYGLHQLASREAGKIWNLFRLNFVRDLGLRHVLLYAPHSVLLAAFLLYALAVRSDRRYILSFRNGSPKRNVKCLVLGLLSGLAMMGAAVLAANLHGDITTSFRRNGDPRLLLFALPAVFVQSATEEIENRGFVFGKMLGNGISAATAIVLSTIFFVFLHADNPGIGPVPLLTVAAVGVLLSLSCLKFGTVWFAIGFHAAWNYAQDFLFGLPNSGYPAAVSMFSSEVNRSGFFYSEAFGIEGAPSALILILTAIFLLALSLRKCAQDSS